MLASFCDAALKEKGFSTSLFKFQTTPFGKDEYLGSKNDHSLTLKIELIFLRKNLESHWFFLPIFLF